MGTQVITMDAATVIYGLGALLLFVTQTFIGWFLKALFDRIREVEKQDKELAAKITLLSVEMPTHYITRREHDKLGDDIFNALRRIEDKLDKKADKE